jgi:hypothetical protein
MKIRRFVIVYERKGDVVSSRRAQAFIEGSRGPGTD